MHQKRLAVGLCPEPLERKGEKGRKNLAPSHSTSRRLCRAVTHISIRSFCLLVFPCVRPILSVSPLNLYVTFLYANKGIKIVKVYYKLTYCWSSTATLRSSVTLTPCLIYMYCMLLDSGVGVREKKFAGGTWGWGMGAKLQGGIHDWCIISSSQVPRGIDFLIPRGSPETYLDWTPRWRHGKFACLHRDTWIRIHASGCMFPDTYIRIQTKLQWQIVNIAVRYQW